MLTMVRVVVLTVLVNLVSFAAVIVADNGETEQTEGNKEASQDEKSNTTVIISESEGRIQSTNYPKPYKTNCLWTYMIDIGEGYNMRLRIEDIDIDTEAGDTLTIQPGCSGIRQMNQNHTEPVAAPFNGSKSFFVTDFSCSSAIIKFSALDHPNNHTGFSIAYERYNNTNPTTTTERAVVVSRVPGWLQLFLEGASSQEFLEKEEFVKLSITNAAKKLCEDRNINASQVNFEEAVRLNSVVDCPPRWPWSAHCIQVNLSVVLNSSLLTSQQLVSLKRSYGMLDDFEDLGISEYVLPNYNVIMLFWLCLITSLVVMFTFALFIVVKSKLIDRYFERLVVQKMKNEINDFREIQEILGANKFTAENNQKLRFFNAYANELSNIENKRNNDCKISTISEEIDDFDSDDEPEIMPPSVTSSFSKANTCYHMYAEPCINGSSTCKQEISRWHSHYDSVSISHL